MPYNDYQLIADLVNSSEDDQLSFYCLINDVIVKAYYERGGTATVQFEAAQCNISEQDGHHRGYATVYNGDNVTVNNDICFTLDAEDLNTFLDAYREETGIAAQVDDFETISYDAFVAEGYNKAKLIGYYEV